MSDRDVLPRNDNIRTDHLKCDRCRTQIFLTGIERRDEMCEVRTFRCPHCRQTRTLHIERDDRS
jgi:DNA-directed RNA polymerase subunit RPC12/RpoP